MALPATRDVLLYRAHVVGQQPSAALGLVNGRHPTARQTLPDLSRLTRLMF